MSFSHWKTPFHRLTIIIILIIDIDGISFIIITISNSGKLPSSEQPEICVDQAR